MVGQSELTDTAWSVIEPLLPTNQQHGGQWRGLSTRYEKHALNYRAMLVLASIVLWLEP